ncbi:hypothetical protein KUTeg_012898 [Tegillarca granosa]|uniref:Uncharacterized protein n=1 Tax=Tegillarca granosa TaxID=220873 RepID=A0ABQ9ESK2_TEGGR|nr:hypothetical protein KUTeg_012898 [Tegillarca granosa]
MPVDSKSCIQKEYHDKISRYDCVMKFRQNRKASVLSRAVKQIHYKRRCYKEDEDIDFLKFKINRTGVKIVKVKSLLGGVCSSYCTVKMVSIGLPLEQFLGLGINHGIVKEANMNNERNCKIRWKIKEAFKGKLGRKTIKEIIEVLRRKLKRPLKVKNIEHRKKLKGNLKERCKVKI